MDCKEIHKKNVDYRILLYYVYSGAGKLELVQYSMLLPSSHLHLKHTLYNNIFWFMRKSAVKISSFMCRMFYGLICCAHEYSFLVHTRSKLHISAEWIYYTNILVSNSTGTRTHKCTQADIPLVPICGYLKACSWQTHKKLL